VAEIVVIDYDPAWPELFAAIRRAISSAAGDLVVAIEHVGSTAVPGLTAKPIVDLDLVVAPDAVPMAIARLTAVGYAHKGNLGVPGREAMRHPPGSPRHHLYVCAEGNLALANHLAVRDYLRAHPDAARAYGDLKRRLAAAHADDVDGYVAGKTAFILDVLRRSGFAATDLESIRRINRPDR
jgi:GrpB-like predicted nucleotidyltransferase (UPF0157 family)